MTPSDLVALVARLREGLSSGNIRAVDIEAAAAIEQLQADYDRLLARDTDNLKKLIACQAELTAALEDASELRALDNEAQHGADALRAELAAANLALKLKPRPYADADLLIVERDAARTELAAVKADAERYRWLTSEPEGARHLLSLLQREGSKSIGKFGTMIDRIRDSKDAARAQVGEKSHEQENNHGT